MKPKVSVIGAGNVGAQCAYRLAQKEVANVVILDVLEGIPQGKALDMFQAGPIDGFDSSLTGSNRYEDTSDSSVIVITAGLARKPGMSRDDLTLKNAGIIKEIVSQVVKFSPHSILLMVTNPLDAMTYHALKLSGFPKNRVLGMAPLLDSARMSYFIAQTLKVSLKTVYAEVLGSHGDLMVPLPRLSTVDGRPITELMTAEQIDHVIKKTRDGGAEIVSLLKTGSAYYAPGSAAAKMAETIIKDKKEVIGACCYLSGEFGVSEVCLGVPARLGKNGIEEIVEIELLPQEKAALQKAAAAVKQLYPLLSKNA
jgi:malate dehydrogenase